MGSFQRATRKRAKLRIALLGPSGSGKTFSALTVAFGLGEKIAVIDTENHSAELYAHLGEYDVAPLEPPYTPKRYIELLHEAERAGYGTIIVDSLSHAWAGQGGLLEMKDKMGRDFSAWGKITPQHTQLIEAMLTSPSHIIGTMRTKTEWVIEQNDRGKSVPRKIGTAPVQKAGMEYEFTTVFDIDDGHNATASKDRTGLFDGEIERLSEDHGRRLLEWLNTGAAPEPRPVPAPVSAEPEQATPTKPPTVTIAKPHKIALDINRAAQAATITADDLKAFAAECGIGSLRTEQDETKLALLLKVVENVQKNGEAA